MVLYRYFESPDTDKRPVSLCVGVYRMWLGGTV